jgi:hypothetical protein
MPEDGLGSLLVCLAIEVKGGISKEGTDTVSANQVAIVRSLLVASDGKMALMELAAGE